MKIAFIGTKGMNLPGTAFGGFETAVTELGPRLAASGHDVTIYCRRHLYKSVDLPREVRGVKLRYMSSVETKNFGTLTNSVLSMTDAIRRGTDVVVLFNLGLGLIAPFAKGAGLRIVTHLDGVEWERGKWSPIAKAIFKLGAWLSVRFSDRLIADCEAIEKVYRTTFRSSSVVIPYGAEIMEDLQGDAMRTYGLTRFGYYLVVTRFVPENNPLLIIDAYLKADVSKPLVILGGNYYPSRYGREILSVRDQRVRFLGHVADRRTLYELYHNSYCYIHGHSVGGTNPSLLEALANSCCVLALDTVFNAEVLKGWEYGLKFGRDKDDLARTISWLERSPDAVARYREWAQRRVRERYTWDGVAEEYRSLLESL